MPTYKVCCWLQGVDKIARMTQAAPALELRRMAFLTAICGGLTILSVVFMVGLGGHLAPRTGSEYTSPMLEFELALTPAEVLAVLDTPTTRAALDGNNRWDFFFMTAYSLLHCTFFLYTASLNRFRQRVRFRSAAFLYAGFGLALTMFLGDLVETKTLLSLSASTTPEEVLQRGLNTLIVSTRVKWAALFVASIALGLATASYFGRTFSIFLSVLFASAGSVGLISLVHAPARPLCELASAMMAVAWLWLFLHAVIYAFRSPGTRGA